MPRSTGASVPGSAANPPLAPPAFGRHPEERSDEGPLFDCQRQENLTSNAHQSRPKAHSTEVPLRDFRVPIELPPVTPNHHCEMLERLKREAVEAILSAKKISWAKDVSLYEDGEITRDQRRRIDAFISHLLAGHDGKPCPCGDRPIIGRRIAADLKLPSMEFPATPHSSSKN